MHPRPSAPEAFLIAIALTGASGWAQPAFEVVSIKPMRQVMGPDGSSRPRIEHTRTSLTMRNVDVAYIVAWAYRVAEQYQLVSPKDIVKDDYEILAKTSAPASETEMRAMAQQLLADRFHLKFHRESKMLPVYELTIAKRGLKLPQPNEETEDRRHVLNQLPRVSGVDFVFADTTLPDFAAKLSMLRGVDRPIVDATGIPGYFDLTLKSGAGATRNPEEGPSIFTLLEEQFGLKAISAKRAIDVLVIDHAGTPAIN